MPIHTHSYQYSDEPEDGFMVGVNEWESYADRVRLLVDPIENPWGWTQALGGIGVGLAYAALTFPERSDHVVRFGVTVAFATGFLLATLYTAWLGHRQKDRRKEHASNIVRDMDRVCEARRPKAAESAKS
jgi:hypothetical protein